MNLIDIRKRHIRWAIEQNPIEITITRKEKVRSGGGFEEKEYTVGPFIVRIYSNNPRKERVVSDIAGRKMVNESWSLLADADAEFKADSSVREEFEVEGLGKFLVVGVRPQVVHGTVVGFQVDLERMI